MAKPLVILGTARSDGETRRAVDLAFPPDLIELVTLTDYQIGSYDYDHLNADDDFVATANKMIGTNVVVFATPVYWYAMSGAMKAFFDRMTDLLETSKELGRQLKGKGFWLIASGTDLALPEGFEVPFARTAEYFGNQYRGSEYLYTGPDEVLRGRSELELAAFGQRVLASQ